MYDLLYNDYCHLRCRMVEGVPYIHLDVFKWSPSVYKGLLVVWRNTLQQFKEVGIEAAYVIIPDDDPKLYKFETKFGFEEVERLNGKIIMMCEVEYGV